MLNPNILNYYVCLLTSELREWCISSTKLRHEFSYLPRQLTTVTKAKLGGRNSVKNHSTGRWNGKRQQETAELVRGKTVATNIRHEKWTSYPSVQPSNWFKKCNSITVSSIFACGVREALPYSGEMRFPVLYFPSVEKTTVCLLLIITNQVIN